MALIIYGLSVTINHAMQEKGSMLNQVKKLHGYKLESLDGEIGKVNEFYFDDQYWTIRYLVADTDSWLTGRQVLISPYALVTVVPAAHHITLNLTKQQIESSPALSSDKPVSQQFEMDYYGYYGWPMYWSGPYMWGAHPDLAFDQAKWDAANSAAKAWDPHLRSTHEVSGYHLQATDGEIGHIEDFIIDDETWAIRYLIVDTRNWLPGRKILISPQWIDRVSWSEAKVFINLTRETIQQSPEYTAASLLTRDDELKLHRHYSYLSDRKSTVKELTR